MEDALGDVQSALVLGGTSEIATAIVERLIDRRCRTVVLAVREPGTMDHTLDRLRGRGATTVSAVEFDALRTEAHEDVIAGAFRTGDIDVVLLAFGVLGDQADFDDDPAAAVRAAEINYVGAVSASLVAAKHLREQGHGKLVVLSSIAAERPRQTNYLYGSTKAGLDAFAQGLGDALAGTGAGVMVVRPGFVHTRMTEGMPPQPFSTTAEAVAEAVVNGLARGSHTVWAPPILRPLFTVMRHLPRPVWQKLSAR